MSHKSDAAGRSHRWATRRVMGSVLGVAVVVVGSAATAQASGHGDVFFGSQHAAHAGGQAMTATALDEHGMQATPQKHAAASPTGQGMGHSGHTGGSMCASGYSGYMGSGYMGSGYMGSGYMGSDSMGSGSTGSGDGQRTTAYDQSNQMSHTTMGPAMASDAQAWTWVGDGASRYAFRTLGDQADPTFNQLLGVNECGTIVGYFGSGADATHPNKGYVVSPPYSRHSFTNENYPGSVQTQVVGVNDTGTSVGFYVDREGDNHGFVYSNGTFHKVIFPGTTSKPSFNQLLGINQRGVAAGFWNDEAGNAHGYLYNTRNGQFTSVDLPVHADSVTVTGVNDHGKVVGFYKDGANTHGFVWTRHSFEALRLGNDTNTQALGINDDGDIVGSYVDSHGTTVGFYRSGMDVHAVTIPGSTSTVINGLNDKGQVVGFYEDHSMNTKGFTAHQ